MFIKLDDYLGANWLQTFRRITGPRMATLPIRIYSHIEYHTDPLVAAIASSIVGMTIIVIMAVEKLVGLNKVLGSR